MGSYSIDFLSLSILSSVRNSNVCQAQKNSAPAFAGALFSRPLSGPSLRQQRTRGTSTVRKSEQILLNRGSSEPKLHNRPKASNGIELFWPKILKQSLRLERSEIEVTDASAYRPKKRSLAANRN